MARRAQTDPDDESPIFDDAVEGAPHPAETVQLFGQEAAERAFLDACAAGRLPHGWLLRGPEGIGKATLAYRIARAVIAGEMTPEPGLVGEAALPASLDPPEGCPVAARIRAGSEPALRVLRRSGDRKTGRMRTEIAVDDVRVVKRFLEQSLPGGGWRAVIVDSADEMNRSSANALLKFLEEPPARTVLLLLSHAPARLLPTIRSRCRAIDLRPLGPEALGLALAQAGHPVSSERAAALSALAGGSVGRGVRLLAGDGLALYARLVAMLTGGRADRAEMLALADACSGREGRAEAARLAELLLVLVGRLARAGVAGPPDPPAAPGEPALMAEIAATPAQARLWAEALPRLAEAVAGARAVNLDPGQTILDTVLDLDALLARARES